MKNFFTAFMPILLLAVFSCSEVTGDFKFMNDLKESISEKYETEKVEINLRNHKEIEVSLLDAKFENYSSSEKEAIALEIGKMLEEINIDNRKIESGVVKFTSEKNLGIVKTSKSYSYDMFR